jgi:hypothetical protein
MRRNDENGRATSRSQLPQIIEIFEFSDFFASHIEHKHMGTAQAHLRGRNKQYAHCCRIGEHFLPIKHRVVQRDRKDAKSERVRAFQQLVRRIIDRVFGVVECMDMQIDFDPFVTIDLALTRAHALIRARSNSRP